MRSVTISDVVPLSVAGALLPATTFIFHRRSSPSCGRSASYYLRYAERRRYRRLCPTGRMDVTRRVPFSMSLRIT